MDPNAALKEIREWIAQVRDADDPSFYHSTEMGAHLAAKVDALDQWLTRGGFLPGPWAPGRTTAPERVRDGDPVTEPTETVLHVAGHVIRLHPDPDCPAELAAGIEGTPWCYDIGDPESDDPDLGISSCTGWDGEGAAREAAMDDLRGILMVSGAHLGPEGSARPKRTITVSIPASITVQVEVPGDATDDQIKAAIVEQCPKYPEVKAGTHFDPEDFEILDDHSAEGQ